MFRSALVWTLTAAFLVTVPVTGAGRCPCRFVQSLWTPPAPATLTPAPPPSCKCCRQTRDQDGPGNSRQELPPAPGKPADAPCDRCLVVDAAIPGSPGARSDPALGVWGADLPSDVGVGTALALAGDLSAAFAGPKHAPRPVAQLIRYAHAFRS
jgi:hypothetical protein